MQDFMSTGHSSVWWYFFTVVWWYFFTVSNVGIIDTCNISDCCVIQRSENVWAELLCEWIKTSYAVRCTKGICNINTYCNPNWQGTQKARGSQCEMRFAIKDWTVPTNKWKVSPWAGRVVCKRRGQGCIFHMSLRKVWMTVDRMPMRR